MSNFISWLIIKVCFVQTYRSSGKATHFCCKFLCKNIVDSVTALVFMCLCVLFICLCWQGVSVIVVCLLETAAEDVNLSSAELLQLLSIHHEAVLVCPVVLSVLCDGTAGMSLSANRSHCLTHKERITLAGPAVFAPVIVCVHECWRITQICQQSSLLNLKHTSLQQWTHTNQPSTLLYLLSFFPLLSSLMHSLSHTLRFPASPRPHPTASLSYILLFCSHPPCLSTRSLSSRHLLPTLSPFLFSCHPPCSPPSLTPQLGSTMRWQWQGCGVCVWVRVCVCLCDVTLQQLYSSSLFFNPCAHRPHCYFKIL